MKTIKAIRKSKDVEIGDIKRVDDKTAHNMVGLMWQYISKSEWKASKSGTSNDQVNNQEKKEKKTNPKQDLPNDDGKEFVKTRKKSK